MRDFEKLQQTFSKLVDASGSIKPDKAALSPETEKTRIQEMLRGLRGKQAYLFKKGNNPTWRAATLAEITDIGAEIERCRPRFSVHDGVELSNAFNEVQSAILTYFEKNPVSSAQPPKERSYKYLNPYSRRK